MLLDLFYIYIYRERDRQRERAREKQSERELDDIYMYFSIMLDMALKEMTHTLLYNNCYKISVNVYNFAYMFIRDSLILRTYM